MFSASNPADYFVSICKPCFDKIVPDNPTNSEATYNVQENLMKGLSGLPLKEAAEDLPADFLAFKVRFVCHSTNPCPNCEALNGKEFIYGTEPSIPVHDNCQGGYDVVERLHIHFIKQGVENLEEKEINEISEKIASKIDEKNISELEKLQTELNEVSAKLKAELSEAKAKLAEITDKVKVAETARDDSNGKLVESIKTVERLRKMIPAGLELLVDPPVLMPVVEHIAILEKRLPSVMAERSSMGLQRHAQEMRAEIMQAKERLKAK